MPGEKHAVLDGQREAQAVPSAALDGQVKTYPNERLAPGQNGPSYQTAFEDVWQCGYPTHGLLCHQYHSQALRVWRCLDHGSLLAQWL